MKKLGLIFKQASENRIKDTLKKSEAVFFVNYLGLSSPDMSSLRMTLRSSNATFFVVKNSVARRALRDCGWESLLKSVEGPCGLIFVKEEPVSASRILSKFSKDHEKLKLAGGFMGDKVLENKDLQAMANLPSKEVLRAQVVMTLNSPIVGLVGVLKGNLRKLVYCLQQIKEKKPN